MQSVPRPQTAHSISHWPIVISTWAKLKKPSKTHKKANPCSPPPLNDVFSILPLVLRGHPPALSTRRVTANFARASRWARFAFGLVLSRLTQNTPLFHRDYSKKCG